MNIEMLHSVLYLNILGSTDRFIVYLTCHFYPSALMAIGVLSPAASVCQSIDLSVTPCPLNRMNQCTFTKFTPNMYHAGGKTPIGNELP